MAILQTSAELFVCNWTGVEGHCEEARSGLPADGSIFLGLGPPQRLFNLQGSAGIP